MGLFSKKPGGTLFGNLLRGVSSMASNVFTQNTGVNLGLGSGAGRIEVGQKFTNKEILANPDLFIPQGENRTVGEIKKAGGTPGIVPDWFTAGQKPPDPYLAVEGGKGGPGASILDFFKNLGGTVANTNQATGNAAETSALVKYGVIALLIYFGLKAFKIIR